MRQAFRQLLKASGSAPAQTTFSNSSNFNFNTALFMGAAAAGTSYYLWEQNKMKMNMSFMQPNMIAMCSSAEMYTAPNADQCAEAKAELTKFIGDRLNMAPLMVRLSWHDAGTFEASSNTGGPRGCMRFGEGESAHGANAGLNIARDLLKDLKAKYPHFSNADFWSLTACCAIKVMGGPDIPWRSGRPDGGRHDSVPDGRLPDATQGCPHLRSVFHRMGFSDQEIVALSGAHAVGMCHPDRSGFIGPWTMTPLAFDNEYFVILTTMKWHKTIQGNGLEVFVTDAQPGIIMLPTDVALLTDEKMVPWVELYAKDKARWESDFAFAFAKL